MFERIAFGMDAEVFLEHRTTQQLVAARHRFPGTKAKPHPVPECGDGFFIQEDNVAVEFNIPATTDINDFAASTVKMLQWIRTQLPQELKIQIQSAGIFADSELNYFRAKRFGCETDINAWTMTENPRLSPRLAGSLRTASAHLHISYYNPSYENSCLLVRLLDWYVGLPSVLAFDPTDRRKLYGMAGSCRMKPYGVEWRVLGNEWIKSTKTIRNVLVRVGRIMDLFNMYGSEILEAIDKYDEEIQLAINTNDRGLAKQVLDATNITGYSLV